MLELVNNNDTLYRTKSYIHTQCDGPGFSNGQDVDNLYTFDPH